MVLKILEKNINKKIKKAFKKGSLEITLSQNLARVIKIKKIASSKNDFMQYKFENTIEALVYFKFIGIYKECQKENEN